MRKVEKQRFEFVLTINKDKNIICKRYFNIKGFDPKLANSEVMLNLIKELAGDNIDGFGTMGLIPNFLKSKSREYTWKYYNPYKVQSEEDIRKVDIWDKVDTFKFVIKIDDKVVGYTTFTGNIFPPKVRYDVNIKSIIPKIIWKIRDSLSRKKYESKR